MSTKKEIKNNFLNKFIDLFKFNDVELNYGFYKIMNIKSQKIQEFINKFLLNNIDECIYKYLYLFFEKYYKNCIFIPRCYYSEKILENDVKLQWSTNEMYYTKDHFIHKDLSKFLYKELEFYIKNEFISFDDIQNQNILDKDYIYKIQLFYQFASKFIDFLSQLENFQKKLWLKKKFILETNYCITIDRIPEELYSEIITNEAQCKEWVNLFNIDKIHSQNSIFSFPLTIDFLKSNNKLVLDTCFFDNDFKMRLLSSIENFDECCDGLLIHSENFQALNLLQEKYNKQIKCIYIDPPYNTKNSKILYNNTYKETAWISLIDNRLELAKTLQSSDSVLTIAIDEIEQEVLGLLLNKHYSTKFNEKVCVVVNHNPKGQQGNNFSYTHEYAYFIYPKHGNYIGYNLKENENEYIENNFRRWGAESLRFNGTNCFYPIFIKDNQILEFGEVCSDDFHPNVNEKLDNNIIAIYPIDQKNIERKWRYARNTVESIKDKLKIHYFKKRNIFDIKMISDKSNFKTNWVNPKYSATDHGTHFLNQIIPKAPMSYPKSFYTVKDCIIAAENNNKNSLFLDYFAGSGTTGHVIIDLNRNDNGKRKFILVEIGEYFDTVVKPRISKVIYSEKWKNGKPVSLNSGISYCFKYIKLESYEDVINNIIENYQIEKYNDNIIKYNMDLENNKSLLNINVFNDPNNYILKIKNSNTEEYKNYNIDIIETFNYLIGLHISYISTLQSNKENNLWFRFIEGWISNDDVKENILIIWRKLSGNIEYDNLMLNDWFQNNYNRNFNYNSIYINGCCNLNLNNKNIKIYSIEEVFMKKMWDNN